MARYIDAERLKGFLRLDQSGIKDALKHGTHLHPERKLEHMAYIDAIEYCVKQINEAPTADVAEVVRCSECKHLEIINKVPIYAKCKKHGIVFELWQEDTRENFCSFGARMDGDAE